MARPTPSACLHLAGPHSSYGGWTATKRRPQRRALDRLQTRWPPNTRLPRSLQSHGKLLQTTSAPGSAYREQRIRQNNSRRTKKKEQKSLRATSAPTLLCRHCHRDCHSRVRLFSHSRQCSTTNWNRPLWHSPCLLRQKQTSSTNTPWSCIPWHVPAWP